MSKDKSIKCGKTIMCNGIKVQAEIKAGWSLNGHGINMPENMSMPANMPDSISMPSMPANMPGNISMPSMPGNMFN